MMHTLAGMALVGGLAIFFSLILDWAFTTSAPDWVHALADLTFFVGGILVIFGVAGFVLCVLVNLLEDML